MLPWAVGALSNRPPQYQNQYTLVNKDGWLGLAARSRRVLALPPELLAEIFLFCLPFDEDGLPIRADPDEAPLNLCAVCRQWRSITLTTPKLWSSLFLDNLIRYGPVSQALYVDLCHKWLARAQSTPLLISLDMYFPAAAANLLLDTVIGLSRQWQNIELGENLSYSLPVEENYPLLEQLCISPPPPDRPIVSFRDAPRLRDVFIPTHTPKIRLPWQQLKARLRISPYSSSALPDTVFPLPELHSLSLGGGVWDPAAMEVLPMTLLKCLKAPALKNLVLGCHYFQRSNLTDVSSFLSFVSQSAFQLHTLTLSSIPASADALIECLKATPSVIDLSLQIHTRIVNTGPVFAKLTGHRDFLPKLESLHIQLSTPTPIVDELGVVLMLIWRCLTSEVARLQSFRFTLSHHHSLKSFIRAHPMYPELVALGTDLCLEERMEFWTRCASHETILFCQSEVAGSKFPRRVFANFAIPALLGTDNGQNRYCSRERYAIRHWRSGQ
ncbi:hypothetical protein DFH08DRAFT_943826 [Mycena albidolilacea]|uniref:F-box domain-containing protein n=1 Tax=Mycena albidolilacea TaxID=1033008 RepID=A0AAD6Z8P6_9AGAR|nr:hypothetical protein DFH08DRAFT_943826 [Mycena albidolilacea]